MLSRILSAQSAGACVLTETHFRYGESKVLKIPTYRNVAEYTRPSVVQKKEGE